MNTAGRRPESDASETQLVNYQLGRCLTLPEPDRSAGPEPDVIEQPQEASRNKLG